MSTKKKKRKTRLKGTEKQKPCVDCGRMRDRFKSFKPRWAGCVNHRTERGRRYHEPGCAECEKIVNGNIRQPRCIDCDKARPKKRKKKAEAKVETPKVEATPEPTPEPKVEVVTAEELAPSPETQAVLEDALPKVETETETEATPEPKVEAKDEPSPESVTVPEPEPTPAPKAKAKTKAKPKRPKIATMADLSALFDDSSEEADSE